jgi:hypothetical protein
VLVTAARVHGNDFGWSDEALVAHGSAYDDALLEACVDARVAQGAAYLAFSGRGGPGAVDARVAWLRGRGRPRGTRRAARPGH